MLETAELPSELIKDGSIFSNSGMMAGRMVGSIFSRVGIMAGRALSSAGSMDGSALSMAGIIACIAEDMALDSAEEPEPDCAGGAACVGVWRTRMPVGCAKVVMVVVVEEERAMRGRINVLRCMVDGIIEVL